MRRFEEAASIGGSSQQCADADGERRYKGVRRRKWGKWVSEIRVPGTRERLWLGSYATPEAAAVAYDTAVFYLRGPSHSPSLNFPSRLSPVAWHGMSPRSIQKAASDSGMAVDAYMIDRSPHFGRQLPESVGHGDSQETREEGDDAACGVIEWGEDGDLDISVEDMEVYV